MKCLRKSISFIFVILFLIILILLFGFDKMEYTLKRNFFASNILFLFFCIIPAFVVLLFYRNRKKYNDLHDIKYKKILIVISLLVFIIQIFLTVHIYFFVDWDVKVVRDMVNSFINSGSLSDPYYLEYLTVNRNNLFITFIFSMIRSIPIIGKDYLSLLFVSCLLVNLAGVFTSLTVRNYSNNKCALYCYIILIPLVLLSPLIVVPYTDTFVILFPILILYLYTKDKRKLIDYYLIGLFALIGYYIKPISIIVFIAIIIIELFLNLRKDLFKRKTLMKKYCKISGLLFLGILTAFSLYRCSYKILKFEPVKHLYPFDFVHYLAMGQNEKTLGGYDYEDVVFSQVNGKRGDLEKFYNRITSRNFKGTIEFFSKKILHVFNDGSFFWGIGGNFFDKIVNTNKDVAKLLRSIYYNDGKYFDLFIQIENFLWLFVISFCPFIVKKNNNKKELVLMLSIIGIIIFLIIFESAGRYLYCCAPLFITCMILGIHNLRKGENITNVS